VLRGRSYTSGVTTSAAPRYRPYQAGPFRWRLGLRPLDVADWIEIDDRYDLDLAEKARVLAQHGSTAFAAIDGIEHEAAEVLDTLVRHLRTRWPDRFGDLGADRSAHPLDAAGRLVQEDLVLLVERPEGLVFGGGSVCFPNRWDLRSKLGLTMPGVHAPVARLNEQLGEPIDRFFDRLTPERSFWRLGWGVIDTDVLYQPLDGTAPPAPQQPGPHDLHLRVERETLRRFPETRCVLFTIRTYLTRLTDLAADTSDAACLADALEALPDDVLAYKQLHEIGDLAVAVLRGG
jgi:hypothetical protein